MNAIETTGLTKRYGEIVAVENLNLTVPAGEIYGFLGPNGAGKTTTLRMLLGLTRPSAGSLRLFGRSPGSGYLDRVGALIEGPAFYPYLSGRANLRVLAGHAGVPRARVDEVLEIVELTDRAKDAYRTYSLGMKQRLGLAAALLKQPRLLLLDEPTNGLDPAGIADIRILLRNLTADGVTVLLSSHLLAEVSQICDRFGVLSHGILVAETTIADFRAGGVLHVAAEPEAEAKARLIELVGEKAVHANESGFDLDVEPGAASRINTGLVTAGVAVSELRWRESDLEQNFLELTGDDHVR
ncbi:ABC transporter ATP-binding protein [Amycolatopsis alkalitolerans]|uniref:ATP-binding cassette domain-containing protein n=1 Tax=Amycolatopsis alkalitolerans TaxID=2547244 RepID=A0A5C4LVF6_9PSEU|nr:ATP-binding cassette domain-containing protein [Amycolatopsis alkalitolerans]TNC20052.1 ATP-binding cassette domain-containing protein [Amycolatopsis alkalitolerans]